MTTAGVPSGELVAARASSGAPSVSATSGMAPTTRLVRAVLAVAAGLRSAWPLRNLAVRRLACTAGPRRRPREHSWGHAAADWPDGTTPEGWLRAGDAMHFTVEALAEAGRRLAAGDAAPSAHTPAAAFGPKIAVVASGEFLLE